MISRCVCNQSQVCGVLGIGVRKRVNQYSGECSLWWCRGGGKEASFVTTVLGFINNNDETAYRNEVQHLVLWCDNNSLVLNIKKAKEIIVDIRKTGQYKHSPLSIGNEMMERVTDLTFLGVIVSEDLSWSTNTASVVGKAQQRLYYLRKLKSAKIPKQLMVNFYNCAISGVLSYGFLVWFSSCTKAEQQALQRVVRTAGRIIGNTLPEMSAIFPTR